MADKTTDNRLQLRIKPDLHAWLSDRADRMHGHSPDLQAKTELGLWRAVLEMELRRIRLSVAEASCLADVLNGSMLDATLGPLTFYEASDAFRIARDTPVPEMSSYATKWGVDEDALLERLRALHPVADHALRDALSRWWHDEASEATVEGFTKHGLHVYDPDAPTRLP